MLYNRNLSNINEKDGPKNKKNSILENKKNNHMPKRNKDRSDNNKKYAT